LDSAGKEKARNLMGTNLISRRVSGTEYNYLYNGHSDVVALVKLDGNIAMSYYYDAFGVVIKSEKGSTQASEVKNTFGYGGYQYDEETKTYYLNSRMYDPATARFLQEDTYRGSGDDPMSLNLYTYCVNNPMIYLDPSGHTPSEEDQAKIAEITQKIADKKNMWYAGRDIGGELGAKMQNTAHGDADDLRDELARLVNKQNSGFSQETINQVNAVVESKGVERTEVDGNDVNLNTIRESANNDADNTNIDSIKDLDKVITAEQKHKYTSNELTAKAPEIAKKIADEIAAEEKAAEVATKVETKKETNEVSASVVQDDFDDLNMKYGNVARKFFGSQGNYWSGIDATGIPAELFGYGLRISGNFGFMSGSISFIMMDPNKFDLESEFMKAFAKDGTRPAKDWTKPFIAFSGGKQIDTGLFGRSEELFERLLKQADFSLDKGYSVSALLLFKAVGVDSVTPNSIADKGYSITFSRDIFSYTHGWSPDGNVQESSVSVGTPAYGITFDESYTKIVPYETTDKFIQYNDLRRQFVEQER